MKKQLFERATTRLTLMYLAVLMAVSLLFSVSLHRVLALEIDRNYQRSVDFANRMPGFRFQPLERADFVRDRLEDRERSRDKLLGQLIIVNSAVLGLGGVLCYYLARRTLRPIEAAHASLERFTSDASHELRTPLAAMRTEIEVALLNKKLPIAQARTLLKSNLEEVERLTLLSERLLLLARLDEQALQLVSIEIHDVVEKAALLADPLAQAKHMTIKIDAKKKYRILGDQTSLTEALFILLDNAIKYSPKKTTITVDVATSGKDVIVSVADQGIGIPEDDQERIFERFYRADHSRTSGDGHGYGLGLPLAQKIVKQHNGELSVRSTPGKGSVFTLTLPLA